MRVRWACEARGRLTSSHQALGIESREDVQDLLKHFFNETEEEAEAGEDLEALVELNLKISQEDVIQVVRAYIEERERRRREDITSNMRTKASAAREAAQARKLKLQRLEHQFWDELGNPLPKPTATAWSMLDKFVAKYVGLLEQRKGLISEVSVLHKVRPGRN